MTNDNRLIQETRQRSLTSLTKLPSRPTGSAQRVRSFHSSDEQRWSCRRLGSHSAQTPRHE